MHMYVTNKENTYNNMLICMKILQTFNMIKFVVPADTKTITHLAPQTIYS